MKFPVVSWHINELMKTLLKHYPNGKVEIYMGGRRSGYMEYMVYEAILSASKGEPVEIHCASEYQSKKIFELMKEVASKSDIELITVVVDRKCTLE